LLSEPSIISLFKCPNQKSFEVVVKIAEFEEDLRRNIYTTQMDGLMGTTIPA